jgi:hypothetical protein
MVFGLWAGCFRKLVLQCSSEAYGTGCVMFYSIQTLYLKALVSFDYFICP